MSDDQIFYVRYATRDNPGPFTIYEYYTYNSRISDTNVGPYKAIEDNGNITGYYATWTLDEYYYGTDISSVPDNSKFVGVLDPNNPSSINSRTLASLPVASDENGFQHLNNFQKLGYTIYLVGLGVTIISAGTASPIGVGLQAIGAGLDTIGTIYSFYEGMSAQSYTGNNVKEDYNRLLAHNIDYFAKLPSDTLAFKFDIMTKDLDGMVDNGYYHYHYYKYLSDDQNARQFYNTVGWKDGDNPNLFYSTNGYLAANADVAKAGLNPLTHYDQYGWKEGRDPSAAFDNEQYLAHNPDVKAAGLDPLAHYLQYGQVEGRQAYAAIGRAADFTHGSFDAEYYLLANADVAKAALALGGDTFAFAYQHYQAYGWHEGRAADAYFDSAYYLAHNPDVAAAHINPLTHYDQYGWKEGRDPSAAFSTNAYLVANPDVAAAHIDPLMHYLQFGVHEGRHLA